MILTLLVGAVALITQAATSALGDPGILVSTLLLLTLGNAASGGAIPVPFLPDGLRQVAGLLPPGAAVRALQEAAAIPDAAAGPADRGERASSDESLLRSLGRPRWTRRWE